MSSNRFRNVLKAWIKKSSHKDTLQICDITLKESDYHKLQAMSQIYDQPIDAITSELLHQAITEIEEAMPYVAGGKVIRIEDGQEIYEDIGPTPRYMQALGQLKTK